MNKGRMLGKGMVAEVYEWGPDRVLKLFYEGLPLGWVTYEAEIGRLVYDLGIPAPTPYEMVEEDGRHGLVYQRIFGDSMLKLMERYPLRLGEYARKMAQLHVQIHQCSSNAKLPAQKYHIAETIRHSAPLLQDKTEKIIAYLERLPTADRICHGDFHPDNILVTPHSAIAIDWPNAYAGNPAGDVARTCLMFYSPYSLPPSFIKAWITDSLRRRFIATYLKVYLRLTRLSLEAIDAWMLPIAAARLREKIPEEEQWLLQLIEHRLKYSNDK